MSVDPTAIPIEFDPRAQRMKGTAVHGDTPFDVPFISQIDDHLYIGGCTNGLQLPHEIKHVVSLYPWEQYTSHPDLRSALSIVAYDAAVPDAARLEAVACWINTCRLDAPTLVHCQAGLNRSSLVTALALIRSGSTPADAIALLREKRSPAVLCNPAFEQWLLEAA